MDMLLGIRLRAAVTCSNSFRKKQAEKAASEDESFKSQEEIQKLTDRFIKEIDTLLEDKSKALVEL